MTKLTKWKNTPTIAQLLDDLTAAKSIHDNHCSEVNNWLKKFAGERVSKKHEGRSSFQSKLMRKHAEWRYGSLEEPFLSTPDLFNIDPVGPEDVNSAKDNEMLLNNQFNTKIDKVRFINEYIRTAVDIGTVVVQVGWKYQKEKKKVNTAVSITPEQLRMKLYKDVVDGKLTQEEAIIKAQDPNQLVQWIKKEEEYVKHNHPVVRVCEYDRVIIDPTCEGDLKKAQFIIVPTETSISELIKDGSYDLSGLMEEDKTTIDLSKLTDSAFLSTTQDSKRDNVNGQFQFKDIARKKLTRYEYYGYWDTDGDNTTRAIKVEWINNTIIKMEELPFPDNELPFVLVQYMPERKSIYGSPDGKLIEDNQEIIGALTRGMIDIMGRSANGQQLLSKDFLDPINQIKFDKGENAYFNPGKDPRTNIHMQTFAEIPNSAMEMLNLMNQDAESLTGVVAFNGGISGQALGNTATGVRGALDSASKRELSIMRRLSKGLEDIGRKIIAMNAVFTSDEEVMRLTNGEFRTINKDDLAGNFDLNVAISTAEADNQKIDKLSFMLQTLGQTMGIDLVQLILSDIAKLQRMPELALKIKEFKQQPDELQQLTVEKLKADIAKIYAEIGDKNARAGENQIDAELKRAKIKDIEADTRVKHSQADQQDLNFVKDDMGLSHQQEIDKMHLSHQQNLEQQGLTKAANMLNSYNPIAN